MNNLLKDKVCMITGVGKGIGRDLTLIYLNQGAMLALITRSQADLEALKNDIPTDKLKDCFFVCGDVSDPGVANDFVLQSIKYFGRIDVLVNNAGIRFRKPFLRITNQEFRDVMDNNFFSMVFLCQAILPHMISSKRGKIINMSSVIGALGLPDLSSYASSKAAIIGLTKSLAVEFAASNIQINAVAPGFSKTSFYEKFKENKELYNFIVDRIPMKRWGDSGEIANVCLFLSSYLSDYVTGDVISVDGGWSAW